jgi:hypothetical protein
VVVVVLLLVVLGTRSCSHTNAAASCDFGIIGGTTSSILVLVVRRIRCPRRRNPFRCLVFWCTMVESSFLDGEGGTPTSRRVHVLVDSGPAR